MTDRRCRCCEPSPGRCPRDATAEDLLCDECRSAPTDGYNAVAVIELHDPRTQEPTGEHLHVHCTRPAWTTYDVYLSP